MKYRRGTNQHQKKERRDWQYILIGYLTFMIFLVVVGLLVKKHAIEQAWAEQPIISAYVAPVEPKVPSLNPDIPEREENIQLIKKIWNRDSEIGLAIAKCESGYRTHARNVNTNTTVDQGVFQINSIHGMPEMEIATANISYAYTMYLKQGTNPWNSSRHCWE